MLQLRVETEGDTVVIDLGGRRTDMLVSVDAAYRLAQAIEDRIPDAEKEPSPLFAGKPWGMDVESFDGQVGFKFYPPEEAAVTRVPLPVRFIAGVSTDGTPKVVNVARKVAELVRFKAEQAERKMRFVFKPVTAGV